MKLLVGGGREKAANDAQLAGNCSWDSGGWLGQWPPAGTVPENMGSQVTPGAGRGNGS